MVVADWGAGAGMVTRYQEDVDAGIDVDADAVAGTAAGTAADTGIDDR
jgi:hypothetical protein